MTKVEAIERLMRKYNGIVTLQIIYNEIEDYYPNAKRSAEWQAGLRGVLYRDIGKRFQKIDDATYAIKDYNPINLLPKSERAGVTEKEVLTKVRAVQYKYRDKLLKALRFCPITAVSDSRLLTASHIKPWSISTDEEKLDVHNGFIFTPLYDKLFDRGLITFTAEKYMLISPSLSKKTRDCLFLTEQKIDRLPVQGREQYLLFHNNSIFLS